MNIDEKVLESAITVNQRKMSQITHIVEDVITDPERLVSEAERAITQPKGRNTQTLATRS